jgi:hypothetical protein
MMIEGFGGAGDDRGLRTIILEGDSECFTTSPKLWYELFPLKRLLDIRSTTIQ